MATNNRRPFTTRTAGRFGRAGLALGALAAAAAAVAIGPRSAVVADERPPYLDPARPIDARVEDLLARLTLEEKVGLVHANGKFRAGGVERLGVPPLWTADGPQGVREEIGVDSWEPAGWTSDFATAMPVGMALAVDVEPGAGRGLRPRRRGRGPRARQARDPRPRPQHPENAAVRPQLRLLRRGPVARRPHDRGLREGHAGRADDRLHQALRRSTTRRRTAARSTCRWTSGRCGRSTCRRSRRACARAGPSR